MENIHLDNRLNFPATERNRDSIASVLSNYLFSNRFYELFKRDHSIVTNPHKLFVDSKGRDMLEFDKFNVLYGLILYKEIDIIILSSEFLQLVK